jgi:hypothetical protein
MLRVVHLAMILVATLRRWTAYLCLLSKRERRHVSIKKST